MREARARNKIFILYFFLVFVVGWFAHSIYANNFMDFFNAFPSDYKSLEEETTVLNPSPTQSDSLLAKFFLGDNERNSPGDRIKEGNIHVYKDKIVIDVKDASWSSFVNTNSMDPIFDTGVNGIEITPKTPYDIHMGDVISYEYNGNIIVHRVVDINADEKGIYYLTKGDNNVIKDPVRVRFEQVKGVLVGLIY